MRSVILAVPVLFLLAGCQRDPATSSPSGQTQEEKPAVQENKVIKVKVTARGEITADGESIELEQLAAKFVHLKKAGGEVWYHRENAAGEPHPNAMKVIELVTENKLPVKLSAKPDFSDTVDDKGMSHPGTR
jgi:biopolymer transport protein ExbD